MEAEPDVAHEQGEPSLTAAERAEVDRRLAAHEANPSAAIPAEVVHAEIRARIKEQRGGAGAGGVRP